MCKSLSPLEKRKVKIEFGKYLLCKSDEKGEYCKPNTENAKGVIDLDNETNRYSC